MRIPEIIEEQILEQGLLQVGCEPSTAAWARGTVGTTLSVSQWGAVICALDNVRPDCDPVESALLSLVSWSGEDRIANVAPECSLPSVRDSDWEEDDDDDELFDDDEEDEEDEDLLPDDDFEDDDDFDDDDDEGFVDDD